MTARLIVVALLGWLLAAAVPADSDLESRYQSGATAFAAGEAVKAIEILRVLAEREPGYRDTQVLLGQSYLMLGDTRAAQRCFDRMLELQPDHGQAAFLLGFSLHQQARYFEAAEALAEAIRLSPEHPLPKMYRGLALLHLGRIDEARTQIDRALRIAPGDSVARRAKARLELAAGHHQAAERLARGLLRDQPDDFEALILVGRIQLESGQTTEAERTLQQAVEHGTATRSDVLYLLAQAQFRNRRPTAGEDTLTRFRHLKQKEDRIRVLRATVSAEPGNAEAIKEMKSLLRELGLDPVAPSATF